MGKITKKMIDLDPSLKEKILNIRERMNLGSDAATIRYCIANTHEKLFPGYILQRAPKSPEEKARERAKVKKKVKEIIVHDIEARGRALCAALEGDLIKVESGYMCAWKTYTKINKMNVAVGGRREAIEHLTEADVDHQYQGGEKEEIINIIQKTQ